MTDVKGFWQGGGRGSKTRSSLGMALAITLSLSSSAAAAVPDLSQFEWGFGLAPIYLADYHGSDEYRHYVLPLPFITYRGKIVTIDDSGIYGKLLHNRYLTLQMSLGAGLPVSSKKNKARKGMAALDPAMEVGPELLAPLAQWGPYQLRLSLAARAVFALDVRITRVHHIGFYFPPFIGLYHRRPFGDNPGQLSLIAGPIYATRPYMDYYYAVPPADATADRPRYAASAGYAGARVEIGYKLRYGNHWFGGFGRYEDLRGATFATSPLTKTLVYRAFGIGYAYIFKPAARSPQG